MPNEVNQSMPHNPAVWGSGRKGNIMNTTIIKQGTENNPVDWEVRWNGVGWYAGAEGRTEILDAADSQSAQSEARSKGLGTATFHFTEISLVSLHGKTR